LDPAHRALLDSKDFRRLVSHQWRVSLALTIALFAIYYGYIVLIALRRDLLAQRVDGATTLGIPLGAGVIVASWILTAIYIVWANRRHDPEASRLRDRAARPTPRP
jgi:uncharacterized membrane protein (DUF485 family)